MKRDFEVPVPIFKTVWFSLITASSRTHAFEGKVSLNTLKREVKRSTDLKRSKPNFHPLQFQAVIMKRNFKKMKIELSLIMDRNCFQNPMILFVEQTLAINVGKEEIIKIFY